MVQCSFKVSRPCDVATGVCVIESYLSLRFVQCGLIPHKHHVLQYIIVCIAECCNVLKWHNRIIPQSEVRAM